MERYRLSNRQSDVMKIGNATGAGTPLLRGQTVTDLHNANMTFRELVTPVRLYTSTLGINVQLKNDFTCHFC